MLKSHVEEAKRFLDNSEIKIVDKGFVSENLCLNLLVELAGTHISATKQHELSTNKRIKLPRDTDMITKVNVYPLEKGGDRTVKLWASKSGSQKWKLVDSRVADEKGNVDIYLPLSVLPWFDFSLEVEGNDYGMFRYINIEYILFSSLSKERKQTFPYLEEFLLKLCDDNTPYENKSCFLESSIKFPDQEKSIKTLKISDIKVKKLRYVWKNDSKNPTTLSIFEPDEKGVFNLNVPLHFPYSIVPIIELNTEVVTSTEKIPDFPNDVPSLVSDFLRKR